MKADMGNNRYGIVAEINMVPFIDIALVLLIIFMILTPVLVQSQIKINLPSAQTTSNPQKDAKTVEVQVDSTGNCYIEGRLVLLPHLEDEFRRLIPNPSEGAVIVMADKDGRVDPLVQVLDTVKKVGVTKVGIGTKQQNRAN